MSAAAPTPTTVRRLSELASSGSGAIDALFERAQTLAWSVERDLAWDLAIAPDDPCVPPDTAPFGETATFRGLPPEVQRGLARQGLAHLLYTLFAGEAVAQDVACRLALVCDRDDYRLHLAAQAFDEARHHKALKRFLDRFGEPRPALDPTVERTYNSVLLTTDPAMLVASMQIFLESLAGDLFQGIAERATHPLLKRLAELFRQDETRHVAFGILYIERMLGEATAEARLAFARQWLPPILAELERGTGAEELRRTAQRLKVLGVSDPWGIAYRMGLEQRALEAQRRAHPDASRVPLLLRSARRAGLLAPDLVDALRLADHPLVLLANRCTPDA